MEDMTKNNGIQPSNMFGTNFEFPAFDFFAPFKQMMTFPDNPHVVDQSISLCPSLRGGWRMRVKLPSGRYKYSYFVNGQWKSKSQRA
ncbi:MAG: hypothetical protein JW938_01410 [Candidatus Omnitrophica bacterium]|nr:hypothetical protein [Candidatus Omnitrophota bacterium]